MAEKQKKQNKKPDEQYQLHELMKMSPEERRRVLRAQAKEAAKFYKSDPDLDFSSDGDIMEY